MPPGSGSLDERDVLDETRRRDIAGGQWPSAVSNGLSIPCSDCGEVPRFDYGVVPEFWSRWVPGPERVGVVCLPCLDKRCAGVGLAQALVEIQWTGTGHTVVLRPDLRHEYGEPVDLVALTGLDAAWREAETAIAVLGSRRLEVGHTPRGLDEQHGRYRAWAVGLDTAWGHTPAAALQALTAKLRPIPSKESPDA